MNKKNIKIPNEKKVPKKKPSVISNTLKIATPYITVGAGLSLVTTYVFAPNNIKKIKFSDYLSLVDKKEVKTTIFNNTTITGELTNGTKFTCNYKPIMMTEQQMNKLAESGSGIDAKYDGGLVSALLSFFPTVLIIAFWVLMLRGKSGLFGFNKAKSSWIPEKPDTTFKDFGGSKDALLEVKEIVDFLKTPEKFKRLGGRTPKGTILLGPPGTGKTLLARCVAGEANVPFFNLSGSDFVELFVGAGAGRVRNLFEEAKKKSPCIIFIDEIDAVGKRRGNSASIGGGHDEREQTLNALLKEMDGFEKNTGVIVIAATNRPEVLDPALTRPGRFDRQILVDRPNTDGRENILKIHSTKIELDPDVNLREIAKMTVGFVGADIENLLNEAAILAYRADAEAVSMQHIQDAMIRVIAGNKTGTLILKPEEKKQVAQHEAGHALLANILFGPGRVQRATIIPTGKALGFVMHSPDEEKVMASKKDLMNEIVVLMGGRAAEEANGADISAGAENDIKKATELACSMVKRFGMSEDGIPRYYVENGNPEEHQAGDQERNKIDRAINKILEISMKTAKEILLKNQQKLTTLANALIAEETLNGREIDQLLK